MATKQQVIAAHRAHPEWNSCEIARALGCHSAYVRATAYRNGLVLAKGPSRPRGTCPRLDYLRAEAEARGLSLHELRKLLVRTIAESEMVGAVLDDVEAA